MWVNFRVYKFYLSKAVKMLLNSCHIFKKHLQMYIFSSYVCSIHLGIYMMIFIILF